MTDHLDHVGIFSPAIENQDEGRKCRVCPVTFVTLEGREIHENLEHEIVATGRKVIAENAAVLERLDRAYEDDR